MRSFPAAGLDSGDAGLECLLAGDAVGRTDDPNREATERITNSVMRPCVMGPFWYRLTTALVGILELDREKPSCGLWLVSGCVFCKVGLPVIPWALVLVLDEKVGWNQCDSCDEGLWMIGPLFSMLVAGYPVVCGFVLYSSRWVRAGGA